MLLFVYYYILAFIALLLPIKSRKLIISLATGFLLLLVLKNLSLSTEAYINFSLTDFTFNIFEASKKQKVFTFMFTLVAFVGSLFLKESRKSFEHASSLFYVGSALGVLQSFDLLSFFIFWELLTLGGVLLILHKNYSSALYYLLFHAIGGLLFFIALVLVFLKTNSFEFKSFDINSVEGILLFISVGINSSFPLVNSWLTDAYPKASAGGTVFLAAITTKTAIYAQIIFFSGTSALIPIGLVMAFVPLFFAFFSKNVRELLSYSIMNPLGFMLVAIGVGSNELILGAKAHVLSHISYKSALFIIAGIVLYEFKNLKLGSYPFLKQKNKKLYFLGITAVLLVVFPGSGAFVSKSLILNNLSHNLGFTLFISSLLLFVVTGLRFIDLLFFTKNETKEVSFKIYPIMYLSLLPLFALLLITGLYPKTFNFFLINDVNVANVYSLQIFLKYLIIFSLLTFIYIFLRKKELIKTQYSFNILNSKEITNRIIIFLKFRLVNLVELINLSFSKLISSILKLFLRLNKYMYPIFTVNITLSTFVIILIIMFFVILNGTAKL